MAADALPLPPLLWPAYHASRSLHDRNALVLHYAHLVEKVVTAAYRDRVPHGNQALVSRDDLVGAGYPGLIRGVETYRAGAGSKPESWISAKVRSAVLDWLREIDVLSRDDRTRQNRIDRARGRLGPDATDADVADELGLKPGQVAACTAGLRVAGTVNFSVLDPGGECPVEGRYEDAAQGEVGEATLEAFRGRAPREVLALVLHHVKGLSVRETARAMKYRGRPAWIHRLLKKNIDGGALPLGRSGHTPLRYTSSDGTYATTPARSLAQILGPCQGRGRQDGALPPGARRGA